MYHVPMRTLRYYCSILIALSLAAPVPAAPRCLAPAGVSEFLEHYAPVPGVHFETRTIGPREIDPTTTAAAEYIYALTELRGMHLDLAARAQASSSPDDMQEYLMLSNRTVWNIRSVYRAIPVDMTEKQPYAYYKEQLKALKRERARLRAAIDAADERLDEKTLAELNQRAILLYQTLLKFQLMAAGKILSGRSGLKDRTMIHNACTLLVDGARYTAEALADELMFRAQRLRTKARVQLQARLDWNNHLVMAPSLNNFDIDVDDHDRATIRQRRWMNTHRLLERIARRAAAGDISRAHELCNTLMEIYGHTHEQRVHLDFAGVHEQLLVLQGLLAELPDGTQPTADTADQIRTLRDDTISLIQHPKQPAIMPIGYADKGAAFRGQVHTIRDSYPKEKDRVDRAAVLLDYCANKLDRAAERGRLNRRDAAHVPATVTEITNWCAHGFVKPKQLAESALTSALTLLYADEPSFVRAAAQLRQAAKHLRQRLVDIDDITKSVEQRAIALFREFREEDIRERVGEFRRLVNEQAYEEALWQAEELRELYFTGVHPEPGYARADTRLRHLISMMRTPAQSGGMAAAELIRIRELINELVTAISFHGIIRPGYDEWIPIDDTITFALIKPDGFAQQKEILQALADEGYTVLYQRVIQINNDLAREFYADLADQYFYPAVQAVITAGDCLALVLQGQTGAVERLMERTGDTREPAEGTIRHRFGVDIKDVLVTDAEGISRAAQEIRNNIHRSDSWASVVREMELLLPDIVAQPAIPPPAPNDSAPHPANESL